MIKLTIKLMEELRELKNINTSANTLLRKSKRPSNVDLFNIVVENDKYYINKELINDLIDNITTKTKKTRTNTFRQNY
tara:strand:- start:379 stop:612 length:234 start_codon:yes stop_codon:yes gene_type:complete